MVWSATALGSVASLSDLSAYSTGSYTPTADRLLVAIVGGDDAETWAAPTLAGNGVTWTLIVEGASATTFGMALFAAKSGATPSAGALTATFGDAQIGCKISVFEIDGAILSGTAAAAFVQAKYDATGTPATSFSVTLDSAPAASSRCVAGFSATTTGVMEPRTNWTEIHDIGHDTPSRRMISEWRSDASEQTSSASIATSQTWRAIVAEIAGPAPVTVTVPAPATADADTPSFTFTAGIASTLLPLVGEADADAPAASVTTQTYETHSGGTEATVQVDAEGAGSKGASGGFTSDVSAAATGAGTTQAFGGATSTVTVTDEGAGTSTRLVGSTANVTVTAQGSGSKASLNGSTATVEVTAEGGGIHSESGAGSSTAQVTVDASGVGSKATQGGSTAQLTVDAEAAGSEQGQGGSTTEITVGASGVGSKTTSGGITAQVLVTATGDWSKTTSGGATAQITVDASGVGTGRETATYIESDAALAGRVERGGRM